MDIILGTDRIQLSKVVGQGGAATVFEHPHRELCVKIYKDQKEVEPARLAFLAAHPPANLAQGKVPLWAWPEEIAYSELTGELQRELHRLSETNAPAPYPQPAPVAPSPSGPIEFVRESVAAPSATDERYAQRDLRVPTAAVRRPASPGSRGATPLAWQLAEDRSFRNVLIFHVPGVSGNDALRREVLRVGVTIGQVYSVDVRSGQRISLRVVRSLPSNLAGVQLWLAEPTSSPANAVAELVTFRK
jgi:hypothetical protein